MKNALIAVLGVAVMVCHISAQEYTILEGPATCEECSLSFERQTLIYDEDGAAGLSWQPVLVRRSPKGDVFLITDSFEPLQFDAEGRFVGSLGRRGEGPGEYNAVSTIVVGPGDTIWVFDTGLGRRSGWSVDSEFLTSHHAPAWPVSDAVVFRDGTWITSGSRVEPELIGIPFHRFGARGEHIGSFGPEVTIPYEERLRPRGVRRNITAAGNESFWSAQQHSYTLERYSISGERLQGMQREVPWFTEPDSVVTVPTQELPSSPRIRSIVQDEAGLLRVAVSLPADEWYLGLGEREEDPRFPGAGVYYTPIKAYERVFDSVIEVIDPSTGMVLASERIDDLVMMWVDDSHVATYREDEWGVPIVEIVRVDLIRP